MSVWKDAVKEGTFLHQYLEYMSPLETPLAYDFWCGVWLLSCAVGRKLVLARPHAPVFLNLYVVLCAEAGTTRKSTSVRMCENIYRAAGFDNDGLLITGSTTPEKLMRELGVRSQDTGAATCHIVSSELVRFLGREQYSMGLPGLLTDMYDCPAIRDVQRLGVGYYPVRNAYFTFLAASTPSWLIRAVNPDVIEGGFTSRCLFIIAEKRKRLVAWPQDTTGLDHVTSLVQSLHDIQTSARELHDRGITLSDSAKARFVSWYESRRDSGVDPFTASFEAREDHHILRLAALLAVNDRSFLVNAHHIQHAVHIVHAHKNDAAELFGGGTAERRLVSGVDKLRAVLTAAGFNGVDQTQLMFKVRAQLKPRELEYALAIMHELEMVQRFQVETPGRPKTVWRGTNKLMHRTLYESVQHRMKEK